MKVLVCGGRDFTNIAYIWTKLDGLHAAEPFTEFMHGGARGADTIASEWSKTKPGLKRYVCRADWEKNGRAAGPIRNARMMEWEPDLVVAFPGGKGTADMVARAKRAGVRVVEFTSEPV